MSDFPEKAEDKVNSLAIVVIGLATTAILWAGVVALQAYFENTHGEIAAERAAQGLTSGIRDLDARQRADLATTVYADPKAGTLKRLAIEEASAGVLASAKAGTSMIPSLGELNVPTVPAVAGKPAADATVEAPAPVDGLAPVDGEAPVEGAEAAPVEGAEGAAPAAPAAAEPAAGANP